MTVNVKEALEKICNNEIFNYEGSVRNSVSV